MPNRELSPKELEWLQGLVRAKGYQVWWIGTGLRLREVYLIDHARVRLLRYDGEQQLEEMAKGYYRQSQARLAQVFGLMKFFSCYRLTLGLLGQHIIQSWQSLRISFHQTSRRHMCSCEDRLGRCKGHPGLHRETHARMVHHSFTGGATLSNSLSLPKAVREFDTDRLRRSSCCPDAQMPDQLLCTMWSTNRQYKPIGSQEDR